MDAVTPTPPYVFPRQRPTSESYDFEGDILIRTGDGLGYAWCKPSYLKDGDLWVPGCQAFESEWCNNLALNCSYADEHWQQVANSANE